MDRAVPFIEKAAKNKQPFFAIVWFHTPHLPVVAGPKHAAMYSKYDTYKKNYYGCVTAMDEQVGRLRATLKKAGVADDTIITFCSDNGPEGNGQRRQAAQDRSRGRKRSLHEGGIRVPGLIEWPARIKPGTATDYPAVTSDYLPTLLDILASRCPTPAPSTAEPPARAARRFRARAAPIGFAYGGKVALTDNRYKIIKAGSSRSKKNNKNKNKKNDAAASSKSNSTAGYMLFDLIDDPGEKNDIAAKHPTSSRRWQPRSKPGARAVPRATRARLLSL